MLRLPCLEAFVLMSTHIKIGLRPESGDLVAL